MENRWRVDTFWEIVTREIPRSDDSRDSFGRGNKEKEKEKLFPREKCRERRKTRYGEHREPFSYTSPLVSHRLASIYSFFLFCFFSVFFSSIFFSFFFVFAVSLFITTNAHARRLCSSARENFFRVGGRNEKFSRSGLVLAANRSR